MPNRPALLATTALTGVLLAGSTWVPAAAQPAPVYNWTGMYVGVNAGYAWGDVDVSCAGCERHEFVAPKPAGALFGFQVGANYQTGMWVWGVESDFSAMLAKDTTSFPSIDASKDVDQLTSRYDWLGTLRARGGIATGPALWYATGGVAAASVTHNYRIGLGDSDGTDFSKQQVRFGWTVGGGIEYAFAPNWSVKLEYLHVKLQDSSFLILVNQGPDTYGNVRVRNEFDIVRAGVNFRIPPSR
jgi:outer membrane immunogenic protein